MTRDIIVIDKDRCNGCGLCIQACHEGALELVDGKARLISDAYCDGLGACLPDCPTGAIRIEQRQAAAFDEAAVAARMASAKAPESMVSAQTPNQSVSAVPEPMAPAKAPDYMAPAKAPEPVQWPVQLRLVSAAAPWLNGARLLVAADCAAYARATFHSDFMRGRKTLIGCPKLDATDYSEKLGEILRQNDIRSLTVVRMQGPCCGGLERAVRNALAACGKVIPWQVVTLAADGQVIDRE